MLARLWAAAVMATARMPWLARWKADGVEIRRRDETLSGYGRIATLIPG
jgi:hypothetical protein